MAKSINRVTLLGNVGIIETKKTAAGAAYTKLSVATSSGYKDKDGKWAEQTQWHQCVAWGKLSDVLEKFVSKGDKILVEGEITYSNVTQPDGTKRSYTQIKVGNVVLLGSGQSRNNPGAHTAANDALSEISGGGEPDDGLPF